LSFAQNGRGASEAEFEPAPAGATKAWHSIKVCQHDWSEQSHSLAFSAEVPEENLSLSMIFNAYRGALRIRAAVRRRPTLAPMD
jgi:hypothetical protein